MTTTCMKDSIVGDAWIQQAVALNPIKHMGASTFLTCPVRLSFPELFTPKAYTNPKTGITQKPKYAVSVIFPAFCDLTEMQAEIVRLGAAKWPESYKGGQLFSVKRPLRDQGERGNKEGYTPGLMFLNSSAERRPIVLDMPPAMLPVTVPDKVYPGVWALVSLGFYCSNSGEKVIAAGLNGVTLYGDDKRFGGAGPSEAQIKDHFAGVRMGTPVTVPGMGGQAAAPLSDADLLRQMMGN
jgi:hypothetical protein